MAGLTGLGSPFSLIGSFGGICGGDGSGFFGESFSFAIIDVNY